MAHAVQISAVPLLYDVCRSLLWGFLNRNVIHSFPTSFTQNPYSIAPIRTRNMCSTKMPMKMYHVKFYIETHAISQSQWPRGLRRRSAAARLLRSWVRIPLEAWMFVCCECCMLSGRGLCDGPITRPEESYRL